MDLCSRQTGTECRGELTVSLTAGDAGRPDPLISEEGRQFLAEQLHRFTLEHIRALFESARVDQLGDAMSAEQAAAAADRVHARVVGFQEKVRQIDSRRCAQATPDM
jgi:hypothetical protein